MKIKIIYNVNLIYIKLLMIIIYIIRYKIIQFFFINKRKFFDIYKYNISYRFYKTIFILLLNQKFGKFSLLKIFYLYKFII